MTETTKQELTTEVKENKLPSAESLLIEELRNIRESIRSKDKQIEELSLIVKELKDSRSIEVETVEDTYATALSSVYDNLDIKTKKEYSPEEAELEFQKRIELLRTYKGTPSEELYWGKKVSDLWHAELLMSTGQIKTLRDFYELKRKAAEEEMNFYSVI